MPSPKSQSVVLPPADLLSASEACAVLNVKVATLYTYVSRGLLHPVTQNGKRANRYLRDEVESLRARSTARMGHGVVAATAMRWGQPVITTSITEISPEGPRYRGHLAMDLARHPGAFENVAELLWSGVLSDEPHTWAVDPVGVDMNRALSCLHAIQKSQVRMMRVFAIAATALGGGSLAEEVRSGSITRFSRQLMFAFAGCCGVIGPEKMFLEPPEETSVAEHILISLGLKPSQGLLRAINTSLIVSADHELASPTFAARIAASVGAGLHACVVSALACQVGSALGGGSDRIEDILMASSSVKQVKARVAEADRTQARLPGFGLRLYPHGDPRATALIELARNTGPQNAQSELALRFIEEVQSKLGIQPNIETGLVALCMAWGMPLRSAGAVWGIGRTAGWIAHILEQRMAGYVLRPRGQFLPSTSVRL